MNPFEIIDTSKINHLIEEVIKDISRLLELFLKQAKIEPIITPIDKNSLSENLIHLAAKNRDYFSKFYDLADNTLPSVLALAHNCKPIIPDSYNYLVDNPLLRADLPEKYQRNNTPWHQEIMFYDYSDDSITIWIPLLPLNEKTGSLEFYKGKISQTRIPAEKYQTKEFKPYIFIDQKYIKDMGEEIMHPILKKNQALVFNNLALHRSASNHTNNMVRLSVQIRFHSAESVFKGNILRSPTLSSVGPISIHDLRSKRLS